jgi:magnesium chelatase subunit D
VNPSVGGVLIRGPSGIGKSTAVRGLAVLLPEIDVVAGCAFGCDPARPECATCLGRLADGDRLTAVRRRRRIVNLPLNSTEDRIAGSLDLERALHDGVKTLEPGLLAEANRGILYVDEVNLLDDHLSDLLLDAAALGVNIVEREGIAVSHPARFMLVGTMNPEEGDLRVQIADRIGLHVDVEPLSDGRQRAEIVRRREAFTADPDAFAKAFADDERALAAAIDEAIDLVGRVCVPDNLYRAIAELVVSFGIGSHRADISTLECAKALAALDGRDEVTPMDVRDAAGLALGHRMPADVFGPPPTINEQQLERALEEILDGDVDSKKKISRAVEGTERTRGSLSGQPPAIDELKANVQRMLTAVRRPDRAERDAVGRRGRSLVRRRAGHHSRSRRAGSHFVDVAFAATLRAAAARRTAQRPLRIEADDLRRKVREHRSPFAVALIVDNSYSLAAESMLERVKGLALRILEEPAHRGDKVALVAFRGGFREATVVLPLTRSRRLALKRLEQIPLSGQTPLPDALRRGRRLLAQERVRNPDSVPLLVAITDGRPTVALCAGGDPRADMLAQAHALRRARIACLVVDAAVPGSPEAAHRGARALARAAAGVEMPFGALVPEAFTSLLEPA